MWHFKHTCSIIFKALLHLKLKMLINSPNHEETSIVYNKASALEEHPCKAHQKLFKDFCALLAARVCPQGEYEYQHK